MTYAQFRERNSENKARFTEAKNKGLINLGAINPYTSFRLKRLILLMEMGRWRFVAILKVVIQIVKSEVSCKIW